MFYTEAYKERQELENSLMNKWSKALNANGGISNEHLARSTAILCENYLKELKNDPRLIAEDRVQSGAFRGVNLALLGLITRVIPNLVGSELVGIQAMPTPKSPIFTMTWHRATTKGGTTGNTSNFPDLPNGDELWVTPITDFAQFGGVDPYYTSNQVNEIVALDTAAQYELVWAKELKKDTKYSGTTLGWILPESVVVYFLEGASQDFQKYGEDSNIIARAYITGAVSGDDYIMALADKNGTALAGLAAGSHIEFNSDEQKIAAGVTGTDTWVGMIADIESVTTKTVGTIICQYEYDAEAEGNIPEIQFKIEEEQIGLTRRQLRGKYTADAAQDLKVLHGINLDSELVNMMKNELMHEINHEIVTDLRKMAKLVKTIDFDGFLTTGQALGAMTAGNYDDVAKLALDAINRLAAIIWVQGRLGYGNFVVGNPATLSYLDRVPGFVGSGVTYNGRDLSYAGSVGGKLKIYHDPTYPEDELLIGYKGGSALETGYLYCPYLPITATPTLYDPETGDPSKIFYTRYSKTLKENGAGLTKPKSVILNGELQYARLKLTNYPGSSMFA